MYKQGGELGIYEELKVFRLTNMGHEQGTREDSGDWLAPQSKHRCDSVYSG